MGDLPAHFERDFLQRLLRGEGFHLLPVFWLCIL
jgi:hypothetical protein